MFMGFLLLLKTRDCNQREAARRCVSRHVHGYCVRYTARQPGESFPEKRRRRRPNRNVRLERSGKRTGWRCGNAAFLAGERPTRVGPRRGKCGAVDRPAPISQVERTVRALQHSSPGWRILVLGNALGEAMSATTSATPVTAPLHKTPLHALLSNWAPRWCRSRATTCRQLSERIIAEHKQAANRRRCSTCRTWASCAWWATTRPARWKHWCPSTSSTCPWQAALRPLHQCERRHPRRPDDHAPRW